MHGVPGDYNLVALDYLEDADVIWMGDANELNAGESGARLSSIQSYAHVANNIAQGTLPTDTQESRV